MFINDKQHIVLIHNVCKCEEYKQKAIFVSFAWQNFIEFNWSGERAQ